MDDFFDKAREGFTKTMETISKKSGEFMAVSQCKSAMNVAAGNLEKNYGEIGRYIYEAYADGNQFDDFINGKCQRIEELIEEMNELRQKLSELKNVKECPSCHEECSYDAVYCSKCGYHFYRQEEEKEQE